MIESIMYFGMASFLAAGSLVVALVRGRAVRLAPQSFKVENQEQKDLPRPDVARSNASHFVDLDKTGDALNLLQIELGALRQQLCTTEEELALKASAMQDAERTLSEKESKLAKLTADFDERSALIDAQNIEIIALKTQVEAKTTAMQEAERVLSDKESQLAKLMAELEERSVLVDTQNTEIIGLKTQVEAKATAMQQAERVLSDKESQLAKLMAELEERSALDFAQEIAIIALNNQIQAKATANQEANNALSDTECKLAKLTAELDERSSVADTQQIKIATLKNQVDVLKEQLDEISGEFKAVEHCRDAERIEFKAATQELIEERSKFYKFQCRVADLVEQIVLQTTEDRRAQEDLENRLADQSRQYNQREFEIEQLRSEIEIARKSEADLRVAIREINAREKTAIEDLETETEKLRAALARANGERMRLSYELANINIKAA